MAQVKGTTEYPVAITDRADQYQFTWVSDVWHHLNDEQKSLAMARMVELLCANGVLALSLRHGPSGAGTHAFATDTTNPAQLANNNGLDALVHFPHPPSVISGKDNVNWT